MATESPDAPKKESSYTYWVRRRTEQAAPDPVPRKLSTQDLAESPQSALHLGSAWNQAGTWEEKCMTKWATNRIEELLLSLEPLELKDGHAQVTEVCSCVGEATLVTVRNKKRFGYNYEITMKFKGDWRELKDLEGTLKVPEASYNDLDDLQTRNVANVTALMNCQLEVDLSSGAAIEESEKSSFSQALKLFLPAIREKLQKFEYELKAQ